MSTLYNPNYMTETVRAMVAELFREQLEELRYEFRENKLSVLTVEESIDAAWERYKS